MMETDPPDPGGGYVPTRGSSPPLFTPDTQTTEPLNRKRGTDSNDPEDSRVKKSIINISQASASIQTSFTHPDFSSLKCTYSENDVAPYIVHVQKKEIDPSSGTILRPIKFGQFLYNLKVQGVVRDGVKRIGRNRFSVEFQSSADANSFHSLPALTTNNYEATIPSYIVTRMGIVRNIPVEWSMEEVVSSVEVPPGFGRVIKARRLNRKTTTDNGSPSWIPTQSIVVTFSGQKLPPNIYCFYNSLPVEIYLLPTIQCNKCCRFGHIKAQCRSRPRCYKCAQNHEGSECSSSAVSCLFCSGPHSANDQSCPEHFRQKNIKMLMSQENVSYIEASSKFQSVRRSFADTTRVATPPVFSPISNSQSTPNPPPHSSYRKTTFTPRRVFSPASTHGYDRQAHQEIISTPPLSLPNGHALNEPPFNESSSITPNDNLLELLVNTIINIITRFNDTQLPNHMHRKLSALIDALSNGSQNNTMELQKC